MGQSVMPEVSVIVPIYNTEKYLRQCINSIIGQTMENIEIILVDDGSTDKSGVICDEYAARDSRIVVIHKPNEGLSCARNDGIDVSAAPYIVFVDSDDWIEPDLCELTCAAAKRYSADAVLYTHNIIKNDKVKETKETHLIEGRLSNDEAMFFINCVDCAAWSGLFHRRLFENVRFPAGKYYEDLGVTHKLIYEAKEIILVNEALYNYRTRRPGSITTEPGTCEHPDRTEMIIARCEDLYKWGYEEYAMHYAFPLLIRTGVNDLTKQLTEIVNSYKGHIPECLRWKQKVMLAVYRVSLALFDIICVVSGRRSH